MLALGACLIDDPEQQFYVELKPITLDVDNDAMRVVGRSLQEFLDRGTPAREAILQFDRWIKDMAGNGQGVFVGFNAPFDWSFVNWYFHTELGENPFGASALDIKAYYCGLVDSDWKSTTSRAIQKRLGISTTHEHHALADAIEQAMIFRAIRDRRGDLVK